MKPLLWLMPFGVALAWGLGEHHLRVKSDVALEEALQSAESCALDRSTCVSLGGRVVLKLSECRQALDGAAEGCSESARECRSKAESCKSDVAKTVAQGWQLVEANKRCRARFEALAQRCGGGTQ